MEPEFKPLLKWDPEQLLALSPMGRLRPRKTLLLSPRFIHPLASWPHFLGPGLHFTLEMVPLWVVESGCWEDVETEFQEFV